MSIDGTCNFARGVRWNAFSLALTQDGEPVVGVAAAVLVAREAGLVVRGRNGDATRLSRDGLVAAHPVVVDDLWNSAFGRDSE